MNIIFRNIILSLLFLFAFSLKGQAQNCGSISSWSFTDSSLGGGSSQYTISFDAISTSGGNKGVHDLVITCGGVTIDSNSTCFDTAPSTSAPNSYSYTFTAASCGSTIALRYTGKTSNACGGSACFSGFAGSPVPVDWLNVDATCKNNRSVVSWSTAQELDNKGFAIEILVDEKWVQVGWVDGQGNKSSKTDYRFELNDIGSGRCRIVQNDYDGRKSYSLVLKLQCKEERAIVMYPNPTNGIINFSNDVVDATVFDAIGNIVFESADYLASVNIADYCTAGYYTISYSYKGKLYYDKLFYSE